jgi:hypothetical protein
MKELVGKKPKKPPPRSEDFDDLEKRMIDVLVDSIKYIATTSGIVIAVYSQILQKYLELPSVQNSTFAKFLLFSPLFLWFMAIVGTVIGIFPRTYKANTDIEKQNAINAIRGTKKLWLSLVMVFFVGGFATFIYVIIAQIWKFYPF